MFQSIFDHFSARLLSALFAAFVLAACAGQDVTPLPSATQNVSANVSAAVATTTQTQPSEPGLSPYQLIPGLAGSSLTTSEGSASLAADDPLGLVRVGLLVPLSGPSAPIGEALLNAAQMALFDVGGDELVLQVYDTQGVPEGAQAAASLAISQGAQLLLGPLFSAEVSAAAPDAAAAGINIIAFSTDPAVASSRVFVMGFLVDEQVRHIIEYASLEGHQNYAVLAPSSAYGNAVVDSMRRHVSRVGGVVTDVALYDPSGSDLNDVVRELADFNERQAELEKQKAELEGLEDEESLLELERLELLDTIGEVEFDAILLPERGVRLTQAASLLPFFDVDPDSVQLLGTMLWNAPGLGREPVMVGGLFPAPPVESTQRFSDRYRELHQEVPPPIANHGYDAVALAAVLAKSGTANPFSAAAITSSSGFAGIDGIFRFTPDGLSQRGFAVMEVIPTGAVTVSPAATAFDVLAF